MYFSEIKHQTFLLELSCDVGYHYILTQENNINILNAHRIQKLIRLHLFTDLFEKDLPSFIRRNTDKRVIPEYI